MTSKGRDRALNRLGVFGLSTLASTVMRYILRLGKSAVLFRVLLPEGMGLFRLFTTLPELTVSFGNLGFGLGSLYLVAREKADLRRILGNMVLVVALQGALLSCIGLGIWTFQQSIAGEVVARFGSLLLLAVPALLAFQFFNDLLTAVKDIHVVNILGVVYSGLPIVLLLSLWLLTGNPVRSAVYAWLVSTAGIALIMFLRLWNIAGKRISLSGRYMKAAYSYGLRGNVSIFANMMVRRIDLLFVAYFLGVKGVGIYAASVTIAELLLSLPNAFAGPFLPIRMGLSDASSLDVSPLVMRVIFVLMLLACIGTALCGKLIILLICGPEFMPAFKPLLGLLPGIAALAVYPFLKADIYSLNRPGLVSWVSVLTMVCNLILNTLMIPRYGVSGAAISSSISYWLSTGLLLRFFSARTGVKLRDILVVRKADVVLLSTQISSVLRKRKAEK